MDPSIRRLRKEAVKIINGGIPGVHNFRVNDDNIRSWEAMIVPTAVPFNKGAFNIEIIFPSEYPFKPPILKFITKIYHPNVDEEGLVCLNIISNWKPANNASEVFEALVKLVNAPEPDHPLRADLAEEFVKNHEQFVKNAEAFTEKNAEERPN